MPKIRSYTPTVVLAASLLLTLTATFLVLAAGRARARARFENAEQATQDRVKTRMDTYSAILRGASGLFAAGSVSQSEFRSFTAQLDIRRRYPGIQGIGFSRRSSARGQDSLIAALRPRGASSFPFWSDSAREEYYPTIYLEPRDRRNEPAVGFDMFTEPTRREAMERARDSGLPSVSGKVILVQDPDGYQQTGFLMYFPVYRGGKVPTSVSERRAALEGFVFSPFRAEDVFAGIFGSERRPDVAFRVYDGPRVAPENLLHDSRLHVASSRDTTDQSGSSSMIIGGRMWTLGFVSLADDWIRRMLAPVRSHSGFNGGLVHHHPTHGGGFRLGGHASVRGLRECGSNRSPPCPADHVEPAFQCHQIRLGKAYHRSLYACRGRWGCCVGDRPGCWHSRERSA